MATKRKYSKLKKFLVVLLLLLIAFFTYVEIVNRNSVHMTYRQKLLKAVYPAFVWWAKLKGSNAKKLSNLKELPMVSFYSLKDTLNDGTVFDFAQLKGKKVMLVNTASDCGYTGQYADLEVLHQKYKDKLVMIGFPANDFGEQEKGDDNAIASFCKKNYGVTFLLMKKSSVIKGVEQNQIYRWLTDPAKNGWNDQQPTWNFCKYLVDEEGALRNFFGSSVEPMNSEITNEIDK
jgi:glutathione peroxidase